MGGDAAWYQKKMAIYWIVAPPRPSQKQPHFPAGLPVVSPFLQSLLFLFLFVSLTLIFLFSPPCLSVVFLFLKGAIIKDCQICYHLKKCNCFQFYFALLLFPFDCYNFFPFHFSIQLAFQSPLLPSPPLNLSTSPSAVIPRTDPRTTPRLPPTPPFFPTILNCKGSAYYWHKAAKTVLESNVRHKPTTTTTQKLPLSYTTAKEKEKSTKFLPIWGNICEDCSELPIYVKNFPQQKHTISSTIDQPVWERLTFLDEKKMLRSRMFGCLTEICARSSWTIIGEIFSAARLCSCNCRDAT